MKNKEGKINQQSVNVLWRIKKNLVELLGSWDDRVLLKKEEEK